MFLVLVLIVMPPRMLAVPGWLAPAVAWLQPTWRCTVASPMQVWQVKLLQLGGQYSCLPHTPTATSNAPATCAVDGSDTTLAKAAVATCTAGAGWCSASERLLLTALETVAAVENAGGAAADAVRAGLCVVAARCVLPAEWSSACVSINGAVSSSLDLWPISDLIVDVVPDQDAPPAGAFGLNEYGLPGDGGAELSSPLIDVQSIAEGVSAELASGVLVWNVLSRQDAGMATLRTRAPAGAEHAAPRGRFFRAHPILVACVAAVKAIQRDATVVVHRWYETRSMAMRRGTPNSAFRAGTAVELAVAHSSTPGVLLRLAEDGQVSGRRTCSSGTRSWSRLGRANPCCPAAVPAVWQFPRVVRVARGWTRHSHRTCRF